MLDLIPFSKKPATEKFRIILTDSGRLFAHSNEVLKKVKEDKRACVFEFPLNKLGIGPVKCISTFNFS